MSRARSLVITSAIACVAASVSGFTASAGDKPISGTWIIGDGASELIIRGATWSHSKYGAATIQKGTGASTFEVFYNEHQGVRCAYRVMTVGDGQILILESADATQSPDYCPQGKLMRADK